MWSDLHDVVVAYLVDFQKSYSHLRENLAALILLRGFRTNDKLFIGGERLRAPHVNRRVIQNMYGAVEGNYIEENRQYIDSQLEILVKLGFLVKKEGLSLCRPDRLPETDPRQKIIQALIDLHQVVQQRRPSDSAEPFGQSADTPSLSQTQLSPGLETGDERQEARIRVRARVQALYADLKSYSQLLCTEKARRESELTLIERWIARDGKYSENKDGPDEVDLLIKQLRAAPYFPKQVTMAPAPGDTPSSKHENVPMLLKVQMKPQAGAPPEVGTHAIPPPGARQAKGILTSAGGYHSVRGPSIVQTPSSTSDGGVAQRALRAAFRKFSEEKVYGPARKIVGALRIVGYHLQALNEECRRGAELDLFEEREAAQLKTVLAQLQPCASRISSFDAMRFDLSEIRRVYQEFLAYESALAGVLAALDALLPKD